VQLGPCSESDSRRCWLLLQVARDKRPGPGVQPEPTGCRGTSGGGQSQRAAARAGGRAGPAPPGPVDSATGAHVPGTVATAVSRCTRARRARRRSGAHQRGPAPRLLTGRVAHQRVLAFRATGKLRAPAGTPACEVDFRHSAGTRRPSPIAFFQMWADEWRGGGQTLRRSISRKSTKNAKSASAEENVPCGRKCHAGIG
jgi:hypothetical protein